MQLSDAIAAQQVDVLEVADLVDMLHLCAAWMTRDEEALTELDRAIGDGDHGHNMRIGFAAVLEELDAAPEPEPDLGTLLSHAGLILISAVGGASGPLYGAALIEAGLVLRGQRQAGLAELTAALEAACRGVGRRGHCYPGDKTLLDTLQPAADALKTAVAGGSTRTGLGAALIAMREAARQGMLSTIPLQAQRGLALRYGPRSIGHQDPGATSCYLVLDALVTAWQQRRP
jgi:dihydroxyacetone kinase-like protein